MVASPLWRGLGILALPKMVNPTDQASYFSQDQYIRRFRYEDNDVVIAPVQPHY